MAQLAVRNDQDFATQDAPLPDGERAILLCLMAVPVVWAVLIAPMICTCATATTTAVLAGVAVGCIADAARLIWLRRRAAP